MTAIRRIMLVEPPVTRPPDFPASKVRVSPFFPLGLAYVAAVARGLGYEVTILDALLEGYESGERWLPGSGHFRYGLTDEEIADRIRAWAPDLVGVGAIFSAKDFDAKNVCRIAKQVIPGVPTVLGGAYAGAACREMMAAEPAIDFVILGEGEDSFPALLRALSDDGDVSEADGLAWRRGDEIITRAKTRYVADLDALPLPARDLVDMERYFRLGYAHDRYRKRPFAQMITSRGCPYRCTFCAIGRHWGAKQRFRSPEGVLGEIDVLVREYGVREIHFEDDNLTADRDRSLALFRGLAQRDYEIAWTTPTGMAVARLDDEVLDAMAASGCYSVTLAIESGNQYVVSKLMRKPVSLKRVPSLVKAVRAHGMLVKGFFMLGYPGETRETILETVAFAKLLELDWAFFFITTPLPHTEMYDMALEKGYLQHGDFNPLTSLRESVIRSPEFDSKWLEEVREQAIRDINFANNPNLRKYDVDQAIADFTYVLELYPHFDFAHVALGEAWLRKGDPSKARVCFRRALDLDPGHQEARSLLAGLDV